MADGDTVAKVGNIVYRIENHIALLLVGLAS